MIRSFAFRGTGFPLLLAACLVGGCAAAPIAVAPVAPAAVTQLPERPLPQPIPVDPAYAAAVAAGTRTASGAPGPRYWQNTAAYTLTARLLPEQRRLEGSAQIVYQNNSPDALDNLHIELTQNFHAPGVVRFEEAEVTGGVELRRVVVDGQALAQGGAGPRYEVFGTRLVILPPAAVAPGASSHLTVEWAFEIPQAGAGERMGWHGDDLFFLAYWYPHMAMYDDVVGWHPDPFTGTTEFYANFARYDLTVEAPEGWVIMATGELTNAEDVLAPAVLERWRRAAGSDDVVRITRAGDAEPATRTGTGAPLRWRFSADAMRDVAFSATRGGNWDAARAAAGDRTGDGATNHTLINTFYRETAPLWAEVTRYQQHAIDFLSRYTGIPYPWPHMTAVEGGGIIGGGMEFPMMTIMGDYNERGDSALYYVTAHELAHMWVPMMVGTDERRYSWMDEGITTFNENQARMEFFPGVNHNVPDMQSYINWALTGYEGEIMRRSQYHYSPQAYGVANYLKPATALVALRAVLGEDTFYRAYHQFLREWHYRHPYPWDLWRTFERESGQELNWFWRSWFFETWTLDQAVASVTSSAAGTTITIHDLGDMPMPVHLTITSADGSVEARQIPVDAWLTGRRSTSITVGGTVTRVEIDRAMNFPDVDRTNNVWPR
jgi:hypothetical protein